MRRSPRRAPRGPPAASLAQPALGAVLSASAPREVAAGPGGRWARSALRLRPARGRTRRVGQCPRPGPCQPSVGCRRRGGTAAAALLALRREGCPAACCLGSVSGAGAAAAWRGEGESPCAALTVRSGDNSDIAVGAHLNTLR